MANIKLQAEMSFDDPIELRNFIEEIVRRADEIFSQEKERTVYTYIPIFNEEKVVGNIKLDIVYPPKHWPPIPAYFGDI